LFANLEYRYSGVQDTRCLQIYGMSIAETKTQVVCKATL